MEKAETSDVVKMITTASATTTNVNFAKSGGAVVVKQRVQSNDDDDSTEDEMDEDEEDLTTTTVRTHSRRVTIPLPLRGGPRSQQVALHQQNPATHKFITGIIGAIIELVVSPPTPPPATLPPSPTTTPITKIVQAQVQQQQQQQGSTPVTPAPTAAPAQTSVASPPAVASTGGTGFPETLHLDHSRLLVLGADAADINANFMLLTLFRQLAYEQEAASGRVGGGKARKEVTDEELERVRREVGAVGPARLGLCFCDGYEIEMEDKMEMDEPQTLSSSSHRLSHHEKSVQNWRATMEATVLQLATRIENRNSTSDSDVEPKMDISSTKLPSQALIDRVKRWAGTHLKRDSPLCTLFRKKLRDQLMRDVVPLFYTLWYSGQVYAFDAGKQRNESGLSLGESGVVGLNSTQKETFAAAGTGSGMTGAGAGSGTGFKTGLEPLSGEVRVLAERLAKLAVLHLRVFWSHYEQVMQQGNAGNA